MIPLWFIFAVLVLHAVGDFFLQTNWMALNKSKNPMALLSHGATYSYPFILIASLVDPVTGLLWVAGNGVAHILVDAITSRITSRLWFVEMDDQTGISAMGVKFNDKKRHWFFVTIGVDQVLHFSILFASAAYLLF